MKILVVLASSVVWGSILFCPMVIAAPPVPSEVQIVQPDPDPVRSPRYPTGFLTGSLIKLCSLSIGNPSPLQLD